MILKESLAIAALTASVASGTPLTLVNPTFQDSEHNSNPSGWDTVETGGGVYVYGDTTAEGEGAPSGTRVLAFHARNANSITQAISQNEATADAFGHFTVSFDSGWRNTQTGTDFALVFSIVNLNDGTTLGSATYTFPTQTENTNTSYRVIQTGNTLDILYDNSAAALAGDPIALRIATATSLDTFDPTAWIDNVSLTADSRNPAAHWSLDGATVPERLLESYGRAQLTLAEAGGSSNWSTRAGFGEVLANGSNAPYLVSPNTSDLDPGNGNFSLSLWVNRTSATAAAAGLVDALNNTGTGFQIFYQANDTLRIRIDDDQNHSVNADTTTGQLALNAWRSIIVNVDRTSKKARFFVDGAEAAPLGGVDISALTGAITPDQGFQIGTLNGTNPSLGQLDDIAFFKRLLTPAEITPLAGTSPVLTIYPPEIVLPAVAISPAPGVLRDGETVTLSSAPGTEIRYTIDGSTPTVSSALYAAPFPLAASATVKTRAVNGAKLGPVTTATFARIPVGVPNVLVIVADDLGFNDLACYGNVATSTPRIDALAYGGQRFTQFTTAGPGDVASQYALLTGRLARRGDMPAIAGPSSAALDPREWTLAESFRKSGYQTGFIGAWHLGDLGGSKPNDQGFVLFHGLPWDPALAPAPPLRENDTTLDPAPNASTLLNELTTRAESYIAAQGSHPFFLVFQPPSLPASGTSLLGTYGSRIEALDASVGRLLDQLATSGVANNTLVVFLSDGGADKNTGTFPTGSNGQQRDGKGSTWEGGVRVPLIARWPGVIPTGDNFSVIWLPDLFRSLAEIPGGYLPNDRPLDGGNRSDALLGARTLPDATTALYLERHTGSGYQLQALRQGPWKLHLGFLNTDPDNTFTGTAPLLFDLLVDPIEHVNRSSLQTTVLANLQQLAASHEATFATPAPQLPVARDAFLGPVETSLAHTTGTTATFRFTRPADSLNDHYTLQTGNNLTGWSDLAVDPYTVVARGPADTETVAVTVPLETLGGFAPRFFVRLKAHRP